jgi:hypothetical protein
MSKSRTTAGHVLVALVLALAVAAQTHAAYVTPKISGGQMGGMQSMIMPEVFFDGVGINVVNADQKPWPMFPWSQAPVLTRIFHRILVFFSRQMA